jgi:DNA polymerase III epsilon subunit family exonuclease
MKYVVFDIETTGLDTSMDRIVEIAAIKVEDGIVIDEFETLINPLIDIPTVVSNIHGITNEMVKDAPYPGVALSKFIHFVNDVDYIIGHNAKRFDFPFIESECTRNFVKYPKIIVKDTLWKARKYIKGLRSYSLASLCRIYSISNENAHRAMSDVYATHYVYLELLKKEMNSL